MGSIIGILSRLAPPEIAVGQRMLAAAPHRGSNYVVRIFGNCILGISNTDDFADASISDAGHCMAVWKGQLDNAAELRKRLKGMNASSLSNEPADLVALAFKTFGANAPSLMRGAFSGIVTDGRKIWCFRDHLGLRPLFYRDEPNAFFVATEPKQIIAGAHLSREPDPEALERIFYGRTPANMPCALKGISRIPQAAVMTADVANGTQTVTYWDPERVLESARLTAAEVTDRFCELMRQAVDRTLTGKDVIFLSGGIDSPTVAAFAAPRHMARTGRPMAAISAVFPQHPRVDESRYIKIVAEHLGINVHEYTHESNPLRNLREWCELMDGPCPTIAFSDMQRWYTSARNLGFSNILTGEYAEFLFTLNEHVFGHLITHFRWPALLHLILAERQKGRSWKRLTRMLVEPFIPGKIVNWYYRDRRVTRFRRVPDWIKLEKINQHPIRPDLLRPTRVRWSELQLLPFKGSPLAMEGDDLCASLSRMTVRRPFADVDLWEFFLSLPAEVKFPDLRSKTLVRRLMRGKLPDPILDRRDKTFFDDFSLSHIDYTLLGSLVLNGSCHIDGIDYRCLGERIQQRNFDMAEWFWARDLARVHAFMEAWA